jgi:hypothetical protein
LQFRLALILVVALAACGSSSDATTVAIRFDVCAPILVDAPEATAEQLASLDDAIAMWNAQGVAQLARAGTEGAGVDVADGRVTLRFERAAGNIFGLYDDATAVIYVNLVLTDERQRAVTIAHELGHAFGLEHVSSDARASVMNPGNLTIVPDEADAATLRTLWGSCP